MIENINLTMCEFNKLQPLKNIYSHESTIYPFFENGKKKMVKVFNEDTDYENKIKKIILIKDRLKKVKEVVTADKFVFCDKTLKGYSMDYLSGNLFIPNKHYSLEEILDLLRQISKILKKIHEYNIVCADFQKNIIIHNNKPIFIDHDNFAIDSFEVDLKNIYLQRYEKSIKTFDKHFDYYLLNLLTLAAINFMETRFIYEKFITNPELFYFENDEITNIMINSMYLGNTYNQDLIIDKIKNDNDIKKIKHKYL